MAVIPLSGTNIRLLTGVPFNSDYKHTRWFDTDVEQRNYFLGKSALHTMSEANFQRDRDQTYVRVDFPIDGLRNVNYLMFQNAHYNDKWFYAFVTRLEYVRKDVTYVHFRLDTLQTWMFQMNMKPSFVVREHCPLWNADGTPVINTVDEGLDYGSEYDTVKLENYVPGGSLHYLVIACKSKIHGEETNVIEPVLNGLPQPLSYYIHPFRMDGHSPNAFLNEAEFGLSPILTVLKAIYSNEDAVNNVVSLYITDYIGQNISYDSEADSINVSGDIFEGATIADNVNENFQTLYVKNFTAYGTKTETIDSDKYDGYANVTESKLLMYPYTSLILDDFKGNRMEYRNEHINSPSLDLTVRGSLGTSNRIAYSIAEYNNATGDSADGSKVSLEHAVVSNNPNDIPIINDYLSAYLQGNRNSIENQKASITFNGVMDLMSSAVSGVSAATQTNGLGVQSPDLAGVGHSSINAVQGAGNTVLQLQAIEAKQKDINNVPPTLAKLGSNTAFDYGNGYKGIFIIKKQIKAEYRQKLTDFFNMYGYKVNRVKQPNFHTRQYWNYVQTVDCVVQGNFNVEDLEEIQTIFNRGITLWHTDDIGNYSLSNEVI